MTSIALARLMMKNFLGEKHLHTKWCWCAMKLQAGANRGLNKGRSICADGICWLADYRHQIL